MANRWWQVLVLAWVAVAAGAQHNCLFKARGLRVRRRAPVQVPRRGTDTPLYALVSDWLPNHWRRRGSTRAPAGLDLALPLLPYNGPRCAPTSTWRRTPGAGTSERERLGC